MITKKNSVHGLWSSRWSFILAATGSAVGLGNIWRFPYLTGEYGGGAFVLVYIACVLLVGIPIMTAEVLLGRRGRQSPINTMAILTREEKLHPAWQLLGWSGMLAGFFILSFYSVIGGWTLEYIFQASSGNFLPAAQTESGDIFTTMLGNPQRLLCLHTLFVIMTAAVVAMGVQHGLERSVKFLIPALFILLLIMVVYAMSTSGFKQGLNYLFYPDWSKLSAEGVLAALGQAFFSLSLGMGAIMAYGAYLPDDTSIIKTSVSVAVADVLVAILAGLAIFPLVFSYNLEVSAGPGLIFVTLPVAFGQINYGQIVGTTFFVLLMLAAWTSAISLLEPAVAWMIEKYRLSRIKAAMITGFLTWVLGIGSVLSFNLWQDYRLFDKNYFDLMEYVTSNVMLPLGGLCIAVFTAWRMSKKSLLEELGMQEGMKFRIWLFLVAYTAPIGVLFVFLHAIGVL